MEDEFSFIHQISPKKHAQPSLVQGIGDDAALFAGDDSFEEIVCMDTMVEGIHFTDRTMRPYDIGYKALAVNISDVAAMGGEPTYCLISVAVPDAWQKKLADIYRGVNDLAERFNIDLIGGDTVSAKEGFVMTATVLGRVKKSRHLLRSSANPGDVVFVTGTLGESAAGLSLLSQYGYDHHFSDDEDILVRSHQRPEPQVKAGQILSALSPEIALNDISDGIASEANEIAEASDAKIVLAYDRLPVSSSLKTFPEEKRKEWVLYGGEDFQLVGTVPERYTQEMKNRFEKARLDVAFVGAVEEGAAQVVLKETERTIPLGKKGFNHFNG